MNASQTRVLVLGGYGLFGQRISARLAQDPRFEVLIAGRHPAKADALIRRFDKLAQARCEAVRLDTNAAGLSADLRSLKPHIVIDTAGPFQARELRVPNAALDAGAHCIDLADGRDYVTRIRQLDARAKSLGLRVISGASSVPGLSAAVVAELGARLNRVERIEAGISPGNHTERGRATTEAILGYVGKPFRIIKNGRAVTAHGWQSLRKVHFDGVGSRWFARCDIPDLDVLPALYPNLTGCDFRAGLELRRMHFGLWLASWAVRAGLIPSMAAFATPLLKLSESWQTSGSDTGVMYVDVAGRGLSDAAETYRWTIIAREGDGPEIPATPAVVLAQKIAAGEITGGGASACTGFFSLDELLTSLAPFAIQTQIQGLGVGQA